MRDITERQAAEDKLHLAVSTQRATLESTSDSIMVMTREGKIVDYNRRFLEVWGIPDDFLEAHDSNPRAYLQQLATKLKNPEALGVTVDDVLASPDQPYRDLVEFKDGHVFERHAFPHRLAGEVVGVVWNHRDITARRRLEEQLHHQAHHDSLTNLLNRRGFRQALDEHLGNALSRKCSGALLLLDFDQFKDINDTLGHPAGDEVLAQTAHLLRIILGDSVELCRLGGDEFAVILPVANPEQARRTGRRILDALRHHAFETDAGDRVEITASVGVVHFPEHGDTVEELLSRVDIALYRAKDRGRNRFEVYGTRTESQRTARARLHLRHQITDALQKDSLQLFAQPILDLRSGVVTGHELLLRLRKDDGTLIGAPSIIEVAERSGLIVAVDRWVSTQAIQYLSQLERIGDNSSLEVNLSGRSFEDPELLRLISAELTMHKINPHSLIFEVTETAAITNLAGARHFIHALKALGCRFALDDFGVGFSSLNHLQNLPIDYLKIDGTFIRGLAASTKAQEMVRGMITIARALDIQTIAEWVTTPEEANLLRLLGADYAQGYWVGRPRNASRLVARKGPRRQNKAA
jgi:diguanylate cyclase (GGDEF)-like protein/PAS domain S-box-containing protein